jgi:hypothetical protein
MKAAPTTEFLQRKLNTLKNSKILFFEGESIKGGYWFLAGGFGTKPRR